MRRFTPKENALIKLLAKYKENDDIESLRFGNFLSHIIPQYVLIWDNEGYKVLDKIELYIPNKEKEVLKGAFYELANFMFFLEELENAKFILLRNANRGTTTNLFDIKCYHIESNKILTNNGDIDVSTYTPYTTQLELQKLLNKYATSLIYPLPILEEYVANNCKTFEEMQLDEERQRYDDSRNTTLVSLEQTQESIKLNRHTFIVTAILSLISVMISIYQCTQPTDIEDKDIKWIESAIIKQKHISIDSICTSLPDTLNVKVTGSPEKQPINLNVTVKENQPTEIQ